MDETDFDNLRALIIRKMDGTLDDWLETLNEDELQYAVKLLQAMNASRDAFVNSL